MEYKNKPVSQQDIMSAIELVGQSYNPTLTTVMKGIVEQSTNFRNVNTPDKLGAFALNPNVLKNYKDTDPFDPVQAATAAFDNLDKGIRATGSLETGLAAYNTGIGKVNRFVKGRASLDPNTAKFVPQVLARSNKYDPGAFDLERINTAAQKVGYTGKADFEALAGGKKNILPKTAMMVGEPVAPEAPTETSPGAMPVDQSAQMLTPEASLPSVEPMAATPVPAAIPDVAQAAQSLQPQTPSLAPEKEAEVAGIFGMQPEAASPMAGALPEGLLKDIRKAIAEA